MTRFVGDTLTSVENPAKEALPGYKEALPMVFSGMYPVDNDEYADLKEALEKLQLSDSSITFEPETSSALGLVSGAVFWECFTWRLLRKDLKENTV